MCTEISAVTIESGRYCMDVHKPWSYAVGTSIIIICKREIE